MMMARKRRKDLSERHKRILDVLQEFQNSSGYPPSIREICDHADISSTSVVNYYLDQLQEMGYIERDGRVSRGIRLVKPYSPSALPGILAASTAKVQGATAALRKSTQAIQQGLDELLHIPLVGQIVAGEPVPIPASDFSYYDPDSSVSVASSLLPPREKTSDLFALKVKGDSMIDAMVFDGDIVIMKQAQEARNGEMVAVWLSDDEETTLKYYYLENGHIRLQPANPTMDAIIVDEPSKVVVQGKVVMVIRQVQGLVS